MPRLPAVLVTCAWLTSAAAYRRLPDRIPPHISLGAGDWWLGRPLLASMLPLAAVLTWALFRWFPRHDALKASYPRFARSRGTILSVLLVTITGLHVAVLSAALAPSAWMGRAVAAVVGVAFVVIGNELPKLRPNWLWGIRTP